jgi:hypothetical protein
MADLRQKVKEDRGLIKKIELAIPGFRGYRKREDLRIADRLLRELLVNKLSQAAKQMEDSRAILVKRKALGLLEDMANLVNRMNTATEMVRHAEQGYTGVSPDYRIEEDELNMMYEWDLGLMDDVEVLNQIAGNMKSSALTLPEEKLTEDIGRSMNSLADFEKLFNQRREAFAGLTV